MTIAQINPIIPAIIIPALKTTDEIPRAAHIGFSPAAPASSLSQFYVKLNHGE